MIGENEMISGAVHRYPGIYLTVEENSGKIQLGDNMMKAVRPVITSNGVLPPNDVGNIAQHVRQREGRRSGKDRMVPNILL